MFELFSAYSTIIEDIILDKEYAVTHNMNSRVHFALSLAYCHRIVKKMNGFIKCSIDEIKSKIIFELQFPESKMKAVV